jgi:hypothetical protein
MSNGNYCACGNDISDMDMVPSTQCNVPCTGNSAVQCGGTTAFDVYRSSTVGVDWKRDEGAEEVRAWHGERASGSLGTRRKRNSRMKGIY